MYFCKNCGEPYMTDEAVMCVKCGVAKGQGNNYCHNCGKPLAPDAAVCLNCGVANKQAPAPDAKSKLVAGLLAIFLGTFGVHNFYLGYTGKAVTQLVLSIVGILLCCVVVGELFTGCSVTGVSCTVSAAELTSVAVVSTVTLFSFSKFCPSIFSSFWPGKGLILICQGITLAVCVDLAGQDHDTFYQSPDTYTHNNELSGLYRKCTASGSYNSSCTAAGGQRNQCTGYCQPGTGYPFHRTWMLHWMDRRTVWNRWYHLRSICQ